MSIFKLLHISILGIILLSILGISFSVGSISVGNGPSYGVYSNGRIFIIAQQANELQEIRDNKIVNTVKLPIYPHSVPFRLASLGNYLFIAYQKGPVIELNDKSGKIITAFHIPRIGKYPAIISAHNFIIVSASYGDKLYFIFNNSVKNVSVMNGPQALAYDNFTNVVYVGGYKSNLIYRISFSSMKIVDNFSINDTTVDAMTFIPPNELAVATYEQQLEIINLSNNKIVSVTTFENGINGYSSLIYDPYDSYLFLSLPHHDNQVAIINKEGKIVSQVTVGNSPNGLVYDPLNHEIYVMNYASSSVSYFASPIPSIVSHKYHSSNFLQDL
ncbi:YncE family protein [Acidianus brierleyi]|uniref:YncE family protein n=1 Tax=Acidianus brierleyi TaxID=41673 RepID=A0A2U9IHF0_9CREN|nr:hypothetical protein [Acidianus brierleyi]AWR95354.1 hypothetical protein DFR85_12865 [Acidianus brierleyi]